MQQEALLESVELRSKFIEKEHILDKVKFLSLLPDQKHITSKMIAEYYEVGEEAIASIIKDHRDELESDGYTVLTKDKLKSFKDSCSFKSKTRHLAILNRRCVLRIGMLLRDSEVAKELRTYLLNIESQSNQQQKIQSIKGSKWDGKDLILYDHIVVGISEGKTLTQICDKVSTIINEKPSSCRNRYTQHIKKLVTNTSLVEKIESNKHKRNIAVKVSPEPIVGDTQVPSWAEAYFNEITQINSETNKLIKSLVDDRVNELASQLERKDGELKRLRQKHKKTVDELKQVQAVVASAIKVGVNETLNQTFRMSPNGNLERV